MADYPYCWPWPVIRKQILERDHHTCQINGPRCTQVATDVDHIIPWLSGGAPYDPNNLRAACPTCNRGRARYVIVNRQPAEPSRTW